MPPDIEFGMQDRTLAKLKVLVMNLGYTGTKPANKQGWYDLYIKLKNNPELVKSLSQKPQPKPDSEIDPKKLTILKLKKPISSAFTLPSSLQKS